MTDVKIAIEPPLWNEGPHATLMSTILDHHDFSGKNVDCVVSYIFDDEVINYGTCPIYDYYIDICDELAKMTAGEDHNIDMSGYTVASVSFKLGEAHLQIVKSDDESGALSNLTKQIDSGLFIHQLYSAKAGIEAYVKAGLR